MARGWPQLGSHADRCQSCLIGSHTPAYRPSSDAIWLPAPQVQKQFFVSARSPIHNALAPAEPGSRGTADSLVSLELGREDHFACAHPDRVGGPRNQTHIAFIPRAWLSCMHPTNQTLNGSDFRASRKKKNKVPRGGARQPLKLEKLSRREIVFWSWASLCVSPLVI